MEAGRPSPLKVQISQEADYKPGFLEAVKKRFVEIGGTAQDLMEEEVKSAWRHFFGNDNSGVVHTERRLREFSVSTLTTGPSQLLFQERFFR